MYISTTEGDIALDKYGEDISFVSHAHNDHISGVKNKKELIASNETIALAKLMGKNKNLKNVKLLDAGHILGSKQLLVDTDEERILYTGDIRTRDSILFKGAELAECDKLIIEATYGNPRFQFPEYYEVYSQIEKWVKENSHCNLLIGGYALGKAQELIKILNSFDVVPVVDKHMEFFNEIYSKFGIKLNRVVVGTKEAEEIMQGPFVGIVEMKRAKRYFAKTLSDAFNRKTLVAVATGWALNYSFNVDAAFVLSNHADFHDLCKFIKQTNAKKIEFVHGDGAYLRKHI